MQTDPLVVSQKVMQRFDFGGVQFQNMQSVLCTQRTLDQHWRTRIETQPALGVAGGHALDIGRQQRVGDWRVPQRHDA